MKRIIDKTPQLFNSLRYGGLSNRTLLMESAVKNNMKLFEFIAQQKLDVSVVDVFNDNIFHHVVCYNTDEQSMKMLNLLINTTDDIKSMINQQNNSKRTPSHWAAGKNRHRSIEWLIRHGADVHMKDFQGNRPDEHSRCDDETKNIIQRFQ